MYKTLGAAALLLAIFAFTLGDRFATATPSGTVSPSIVASRQLTGRTTMIPTTALFTPSTTGLYRVSAYIAMSTSGTTGCPWDLTFGWTDDAGAEQASELLQLSASAHPPSAYGFGENALTQTAIMRAVAGSPITYTVPATGCSGDNGTYELFMTVERLQ
jgi:hypothetical protein